ncbi:Outer membrane protein TolC [Fibrobacter sp. UWT3]|uniref:TolC family protein n=1 Tax=Fibrobacter sp. UWT3 TaxID=1896225 RepID=UPI000BD53A65|nr:TolC family protein [Fibrobacter sp. UWT3]SOE56092.1 Outer membrane protein TolC [Fibrobacter sp. UWT3]
MSFRAVNIIATLAVVAALAAEEKGDSLYLDFGTALQAVLTNNADVTEAKFAWLSESEAATGAYGKFEPRLVGRAFKEAAERPGALFTETKEEYKIGVQGALPTGTEYNVGFNQATYTHSDYTSELYFGGELRQHLLKDGPLFFSATNELEQARLRRELAYQKYRDALNDVLEKFCDAYWNYYYADRFLASATESARVAKDIVEDAGKRLKQGLLSPLDYSKAVAEYSDRESARLDALDKLRGARLTLLLTLSSGEYIHDPRPIAMHPDLAPDSAARLDSLTFLDSMSLMHPGYLSQGAEVMLRESELSARRADWLPTVDLIGNYGIRSRNDKAREAVRNFKTEGKRQTVLAGGIEINIPLFGGVAERHRISAQKYSVRAARTRLMLLQAQIFEEYRILQNRAQEIREQWRYGQIAVEYHQKELEEEFKKLTMGKSNYREIFEMEEDLREAERRQLENMRTLRIIDVRLMRATGKLLLQNGLETWKNEKLVLREDLTAE